MSKTKYKPGMLWETAGKGNKFFAIIKAIIFITAGLMYLFWTLDFIPDVLGPVVGRIDDAIVWLLVAWSIRGAINTILSKKDAFLGLGGKKK